MTSCQIRHGAAVLTLLAASVSHVFAQSRDRTPGPRKPTNTEMLAEFGFEATPASLTKALDSPDAFARIYALRVIAEKGDRTFAPQALAQLKHDFIKVQVEAAKVLAQFDREEGLQWLRDCEKRMGDDPNVPADTAHAVLDAASALASRGDERLARQVGTCLAHESWAVRIHAARAMADFKDLSRPALQKTWLASARVVAEALRDPTEIPSEFVELYLRWLTTSAAAAPRTTPAVSEGFVELLSIKHEPTAALRQKLADTWIAKPVLAEADKPAP